MRRVIAALFLILAASVPVDALGRVESMFASGAGDLVTYRYMGAGRRIGVDFGNGLSLAYDGGAGGNATGLDGFGRVVDLDYRLGDYTALGYEYAYDLAGNRTLARIERQGPQGLWVYGYDPLNRLVRATNGRPNAAGDGFEADPSPVTVGWDLDSLGNWSGGTGPNPISVRRFADADGDGLYDVGADVTLAAEHHDTNSINEIEAREVDPPSAPRVITPFYYDAAGNLVFDGQRHYVYDAWNRLVQVDEPGSLHVAVEGELQGTAGPAIARYEYDALGRRIVTETWAEPRQTGSPPDEVTRHVYGGGAEVLAEYDLVDAGTGGITETLERWFVHGDSFPDPLVMVDLTDLGDVPAAGQPGGGPEYLFYLKDALGSVGALANAGGYVVERYTYDPYGQVTVRGGGGAGLPRLPATYQFDSDRDGLLTDADLYYFEWCLGLDPSDEGWPWWPCVFYHDANHNGVVDVQDRAVFAGVPGVVEWPGSFSVQPPAEFLRDSLPAGDGDADGNLDLWDWSADLQCQGAEHEDCVLVYELDGQWPIGLEDMALLATSMEGPEQAVPEPGGPSRYGNPFLYTGQRYDPATGLYHFWARSYDPVLGRWLQRDMLGALAASGDISLASGAYGPSVGATQFGPGDEYGDGFSLYQYVNSNPINSFDPYGLYDWFDETDDLLDDLTGHKLYALGMLNEGAKWAALGLQTSLSIAGSLLPGAGLYDAFKSVQLIASGQGGFWDVLNIATAGAEARPILTSVLATCCQQHRDALTLVTCLRRAQSRRLALAPARRRPPDCLRPVNRLRKEYHT